MTVYPTGEAAFQPTVEDRLHQIFARFADEPGPSYHHSGGDLSYADLHTRAALLRHQLATGPLGGTERPPVLIWGHKDYRYVIAYWACLLGGWALVPVESDTPVERVRQIAETCGAGALLIADSTLGIEAEITDLLPVVRVDDGGSTALAATDEAVSRPPYVGSGPEDVAYIMFSSGTLGQPKGIRVTYANLVDFIDWIAVLLPEAKTWQGVTGNIRYCFDVSLFEIWTAWLHLLPVSALDHFELSNSNRLIRKLAADRVSFWVSTPSIVRLFLKNKRFNGENLPFCGTFLFCGEPLTKTIVQQLFARFPGCRVVNTYGPTECTVAVTSIDITEAHLADVDDLPIGNVRPGTVLEHSTHAKTRAKVNEGKAAREIYIRGASVGSGYVDLPDKQARAFPETGLYRTGDWGYCTPCGVWYFKGRMDRETKIQGVRIDLNDVENSLRALDSIEDAVVSVYSLGGQNRALNAFVLGPDSAAELQALAEQLAVELPSYLVPRFWYADFAVKLNNNSKLDHKEVLAAAGTAQARYVHSVLPAE